ncbi:exo-alpha-sialidase [Gammaproteobacteria bacterium LSUCC0112]|nr:exo-alpha-sialidase [Gammaproteobacteria bacterium LSUCC0112]
MDQRRSALPRFLLPFVLLSLLLSGCMTADRLAGGEALAPHLQWLAFRVRSDANAALNADAGWAAAENAAADIFYDQPFRFRVQVKATESPPEGHVLSLQYRQAGQLWLPVGFAKFPYPDFATPVISVIDTPAYAHGAETERLLGTINTAWDDGAGINGVAATPVWRTVDDALEWEWPLVIRRFSDGPTFADNNVSFELRVVDGFGRPLPGQRSAQLQLTAPARHLGGTFIESPARIGPYQSEAGHLYFFMEPSETDNRFMAVTSTDFGQSWREIDGSNRPDIGDLEGVATARTGSTLHLIHQISEEVFYHAFDMDGPNTDEAQWRVNAESMATFKEPPTQFADLVARADGSLVTLYAGAQKLFLQTRSVNGIWASPVEIDTLLTPDLSGPVLAIGPDDLISMAYTGRDGSGFIRHLRPDGALTDRQLFSSSLGTSDDENGAIVPMAVVPETGETVLVYREQSGMLYERRLSREGQISSAVQLSALPVITNAVDSEQVGADLIVHGTTVHVLFIEAQSRAIFHTYARERGIWSTPQRVVEAIQGSWVRGSVHKDSAGNPVYGFVYDAGSTGGSGFNRYFALPL